MESFVIDNITQKDIENKLIRIKVSNKRYFPSFKEKGAIKYSVKVKIGSEIYEASYRVEKNRSGRLRIGSEAYKNRLCLKAGDKLKINVLEKDKMYEIKKLDKSI